MTIGDHIRLHRSERKLLRREVADQIGVSPATVGNWEQNRTEPAVDFMPAIIRFLGYDPTPAPATLDEQMRAYRHRRGLSIKAAALRAGVHEDSWGEWERTGLIPRKRYRALLDEFLAGESEDDRSSTLTTLFLK
ncbi:XRE family transcriptional regulator [Variovorax paradoxus]|nr:helix-turn-helix transcriptional regulator [Variovorax paradoxus]MBT2299447.1 XRE family transcriptional regulator [Variovorax paradoxus]